MKKILLATLLVSITSASLALTNPNPQAFWNSFYVGGHVTGIKGNTTGNTLTAGNTLYSTTVNYNESFDNKNVDTTVNPGLGLFAGYGGLIGDFYLGARLGLSYSHYKQSRSYLHSYSQATSIVRINTSNKTTVELPGLQYSLTVTPGYLLNPQTILYLQGGIQLANIKIDSVSQMDLSAVTPPNTLSVREHTSRANYHLGWQLGLGITRLIKNNWTLHLAYKYVYYGRVGTNGYKNFNSAGFLGSLSSSAHATVATQNLDLGVSYHFPVASAAPMMATAAPAPAMTTTMPTRAAKPVVMPKSHAPMPISRRVVKAPVRTNGSVPTIQLIK